jgi:hypothetical protein
MDATPLAPSVRTFIDPTERDLGEIDAAIDLVAQGLATRVRLVGLMRPEAVAAIGLAHAHEARIAFSLDRKAGGRATVTLGPRS